MGASMQQSDPVKILMVDDQPGKLLSYEAILGELGETLLKASSAQEALAHLLRNDVAVVLIDVQMPDIDGFELAAMIREHPRFGETALIFVSAIHLSDLDRLKGYEAGAVDYVPVPVAPSLLRARVRVFAELHRKTRALERLNAELEQRVAERTAALEASSQALQQLNGELEARIETRTQEREQAMAQLFEAQKIDTIGQLTGGVAHDFNNLLMAVMGSMQLLKKRLKEDPASQRLVDNAIQGAERGTALTQRLLAFARRQELRPAAVDVVTLVSGMRDLLARALGPGVRLAEDFPADLPPILIDANQLELALLNLSVNARDAMPEGGVLTLSAAEADEGKGDWPPGLGSGRYVRLSIADTGVGMAPEVLARATEPFYTTKGVGKGTGLGLSMVHGLAGQSGGALKLSSAPGQGVCVQLWIPVADRAAAQPAIRPEAVAIDGVRRVSVLLVDDDALVLMGTTAMLEDLGHTVSPASSAAEALALLDGGCKVEVVVTDHAMPGMTGLDLALVIRERRPDLPVVLATGYAELPWREKTIDLPRLSKPYLQEDLQRCFATLWPDPASSESARAAPRRPMAAGR